MTRCFISTHPNMKLLYHIDSYPSYILGVVRIIPLQGIRDHCQILWVQQWGTANNLYKIPPIVNTILFKGQHRYAKKMQKWPNQIFSSPIYIVFTVLLSQSYTNLINLTRFPPFPQLARLFFTFFIGTGMSYYYYSTADTSVHFWLLIEFDLAGASAFAVG